MANPGDKGPGPKLAPPGSAAAKATAKLPYGKKKPPSDKDKRLAETAAHAQEVKELAAGSDFVEAPKGDRERRPAAFDRLDLQVVRSWVQSRPLEPHKAAAAMIPFPRQWTTKRGRYAKFRAPGAGVYALLRARPTF